MLQKGVLLVLLILTIINSGIYARSCSRCSRCSCTHANNRADNAVRQLTIANDRISRIRESSLSLGKDFKIEVFYPDEKIIGTIHDVYHAEMNIPKGSMMRVVPRVNNSDTVSTIIYYDSENVGLFTNLASPGNYVSSQISLPKNSVSSVIVPPNFQVILYAGDYFRGDHMVLTSNNGYTRYTDLGKFNDKTVSIDIVPIVTKLPEHVVVVYSLTNQAGKMKGLTVGENRLIGFEIKSIRIDGGYEVLFYKNDILYDVINSNKTTMDGFQNDDSPIIAIVRQIQLNPEVRELYTVLFSDVDFKGSKTFLSTKSASILNMKPLISSLLIPKGYEAILYDQADLEGSYIILRGDVTNLNLYAFNDRAVSILLRSSTDENPMEHPIIYQKPDYHGESLILPIGLTKCSNTDNLLGLCRITNHQRYASSLSVPIGYKVTVMKEPTPLTNNERIYEYIESNSDIRNFIDTPILSFLVEKK